MSFLIALHLACFISAVFVYVMKGCRNIKKGCLHCLLYAPIIIPSEATAEGPYLSLLTAFWTQVPTIKLMFIYITVTCLENSLKTPQSRTMNTIWFRGKPTLTPSSLCQRTYFNILYASWLFTSFGVTSAENRFPCKKRKNKLLHPFRCLQNCSVNLLQVDNKALERSFLCWNNFIMVLWWLKVSIVCTQNTHCM